MKTAKLLFVMTFICLKIKAQQISNEALNQKYKLSLIFGLNQPIFTKGFNVEVNYYTEHFVFDYSHGFNLHFQDNLVSDESKRQHLKYNISHSLGIGVGYRITPELNIRIEPKIHLWNVYYDDKDYSDENIIKKYTTYTLGLGAYYRWIPFKNSDSFTKGITFVPSVRWWPNVQTSLKDDKFEYSNRITNKTEIHEANNIGFGNSPFFGNLSVGYSF
jgi:hypothetical protein